MQAPLKIAILGGGEEELNVLSEFHRNPTFDIIAIYDRDPMAIALEIAEIIGIPTYTDNSFLSAFRDAEYIVVTRMREFFKEEIHLLQKYKKKIINPSEAASYLAASGKEKRGTDEYPWPLHLEEALKYINRITDRERLLKWLLEISVRAVEASSGSIMLFSEKTKELYIGYATGLSQDVIRSTRQGLGVGIAGKVAGSRKAQLIEEIVETPLYEGGRERQEIQSAISAPLIHQGQLVGVLNVSTNTGEKALTEEDVETIKLLASKMVPILQQHLKIDVHEIREMEFQIRNYLESLYQKDAGFHDKFTLLCGYLGGKLEADTITIYTATDEGDWLILGGSDQLVPVGSQSPRIHCIKGSLARAYLNREEVLMTEAVHDAELKLKSKSGALTSIYIPLVHNEPLGVIVLEFSNLDALERFFKIKEAVCFQVSFFVHSQIGALRQSRKMESLEELSALTPTLVSLNGISNKIGHLPELISSLINAAAGSFHYSGPEGSQMAYYKFPEKGEEKKRRLKYDSEIMAQVMEKWEPTCLSVLSIDVDMYEKPPLYHSVIAYPMFRTNDAAAVYIGYDKIPKTSLDSSIFGDREMGLLGKVSAILIPIFKRRGKGKNTEEHLTFDDLLRTNQKTLLDHIRSEIERAERYHHGFVLTLYRIKGLRGLLKKDYYGGLNLINELSSSIRKQVRKTDYFSWIESDIFGVMSLESYRSIGYLENRLTELVKKTLKTKNYFDSDNFYPESGCALYPGDSNTAPELVSEAKAKLK